MGISNALSKNESTSASGNKPDSFLDSIPTVAETLADMHSKVESVAAEAQFDRYDSEGNAEPSDQRQTDAANDGDAYSENSRRGRPRWIIPLFLFFATCVSTYWVALTQYSPVRAIGNILNSVSIEGNWNVVRRLILEHGSDAIIYMICVMAILLVHELGHFFATIIYRIAATYPIFLPFPLNPIGTFGAVIGMSGGVADRKQIFDVGLAGPLAGLVVAVPVMLMGVLQLDVSTRAAGELQMQCPYGVMLMIQFLRPDIDLGDGYVWLSHVNPFFAAGWVGFLITGLNMMPISQLDGGHVTYTLFGKGAHWIARIMIIAGIAFMVYHMSPSLVLMIVLIMFVGIDHPPTRDDSVKLGWFRTGLGLLSLSIPFLCFPPFLFKLAV